MADQHQLKVLRKGRGAWNTWRNQHPVIQPELSGANLYHANLSGANLSDADLNRADLSGADLSGAAVGWTQFTAINLRTVKGLETVQHIGPSSIGIDTIYRSEGHIPETFLRKAGVPEDFLTYMHSLVAHPIEYYTCFISYSSRNKDFAERLYTDLQSKGVRCWFAPEDMKTGDKIRQRIDESIRLYDKLLLVLSKHSIASSWVEFEVEAAFAKEDEKHDDYQKALTRLLRDLKAETPQKESTT